ncbi:MAG TPA: porin family protein [Salinivirgaceae bacterium]|nr:porin family protein [Salinivirgaceae bacterium]
MKNLFFVLLTTLGLTVQAQLFKIGNIEIGYLYLGPKISSSLAFMTNTTSSGMDTKPLLGYSMGVSGKFGITSNFGIETGLDFSRKGFKETSQNMNIRTFADYFGIPVLAKLRVIKFGNFHFQGTGGIYSGVTTSITTKMESDQFSETSRYSSDTYRKVDFGFNLGAGIDYDFGNALLVTELFYSQGVVDVFKNNVSQDHNTNQLIGISIAYLFDWVDITHKLLK